LHNSLDFGEISSLKIGNALAFRVKQWEFNSEFKWLNLNLELASNYISLCGWVINPTANTQPGGQVNCSLPDPYPLTCPA
jgi:hypothetical protein